MDIEDVIQLHEYIKENEEDIFDLISERIDHLESSVSSMRYEIERLRQYLEEKDSECFNEDELPYY